MSINLNRIRQIYGSIAHDPSHLVAQQKYRISMEGAAVLGSESISWPGKWLRRRGGSERRVREEE